MWALRQSTGVHSAVHAIITIASLCKRMKSLPILPLSKNIALFFDLERLSSLTLLSQFLRRVKKKKTEGDSGSLGNIQWIWQIWQIEKTKTNKKAVLI